VGDYFTRIAVQIGDFFKSLSNAKKLAMGGIAAAILAALVGMFFWAGNTSYVPMMSNLNPEDSTNIIRILRDKHIPFKLDATGKNILVPSENLYELRLELATMGLPQSSVVGYELFDKQSLGTTSFVQKLNQKRAQEGELMRTINTIKGVRRSRVHLALPQKTTFVEDQRKSTASVVVDMEIGATLSEKQVFGIGNLVARATEGLEVTDVVIMNSDGKILSKNPSDPLAAATASQLDFQGKVESDLEKRIETMLSHAVGDGHVAAKVNADLDFAQVNETQTLYDADGSAVMSVEKHNDSMNGTRPGPYGTVGNVANAPGTPPATNGEVKTETIKSNETTNYQVPQTVRRTTKSVGAVKRLSVAVMIDGKTVKTTNKDGKVITTVESWPPEKLKEFQDIAASAVGLDKKRGDTLEIKNMEFTHEDLDEAQRVISEKESKTYMQNMVMYGIVGMIILLFFFFVVRPFIKWVTENTIDSVDTFLPQTIEELERMQRSPAFAGLEDAMPMLPESVDPAKVEGEMIKEKIITLVDANPHKAALILKDWLHGEMKKKVAEGKPAEGAKENKATA
jgi:flagellar M-ring protein FliF